MRATSPAEPVARPVRWLLPLAVVAVAALTRLWNLGSPRLILFDESYYVKGAYSMLRLGYASNWPAGSNAKFAAGQVNGYLTSPERITHPPLGNWIIGLGMDVFGVQNPVSWRISSAIVGILAVILIMAIAGRLFHSFSWGVIAGGLLAIDGNAIVMSRVGLLDNFVMFFALLGFGAILLDRRQSEARLARRLEDRGAWAWGPSIWFRPWLFAAGLAFGLDTAVKWSGLFFLVAFGVYVVVVDALARRRAGVPHWVLGTLGRQATVDVVLYVPIALVGYLASWIGWFLSPGSLYRNWAETHPAGGALSWIPKSVQSFWHVQQSMYAIGATYDKPNPYSSPAIDWLFMIRPLAVFSGFVPDGQHGCSDSPACVEVINAVANPLIWWGGAAAVFVLLFLLIFGMRGRGATGASAPTVSVTPASSIAPTSSTTRARDWRIGLILMGIVAGYLPWFFVSRTTVFQYYSIAFEPYLILALVYVLRLATVNPATVNTAAVNTAAANPAAAARAGRRIVGGYLIACVLLSIFFLPIWIGLMEPAWFVNAHYWLESWH